MKLLLACAISQHTCIQRTFCVTLNRCRTPTPRRIRDLQNMIHKIRQAHPVLILRQAWSQSATHRICLFPKTSNEYRLDATSFNSQEVHKRKHIHIHMLAILLIPAPSSDGSQNMSLCNAVRDWHMQRLAKLVGALERCRAWRGRSA